MANLDARVKALEAQAPNRRNLLRCVACGHDNYLRPVAGDPERVLDEGDGDAD